MITYIQNSNDDRRAVNNKTAQWGFAEKGYHIIPFDHEKVDELEVGAETVVVGGITVVRRALANAGVQAPLLDYIPQELMDFAGRRIWLSTLGEARESQVPVFIKPQSDQQKLFTGFVFNEFRDLITTASHSPEIKVMCSEVVNFISEYRVFVIEKEIVGIKHYCGDFRVFPDFAVIDRAVGLMKPVHAGYGIDFGVTAEGKTLLVEVNGGHSLGCYGLNPIIYATLLEKTWSKLFDF